MFILGDCFNRRSSKFLTSEYFQWALPLVHLCWVSGNIFKRSAGLHLEILLRGASVIVITFGGRIIKTIAELISKGSRFLQRGVNVPLPPYMKTWWGRSLGGKHWVNGILYAWISELGFGESSVQTRRENNITSLLMCVSHSLKHFAMFGIPAVASSELCLNEMLTDCDSTLAVCK